MPKNRKSAVLPLSFRDVKKSEYKLFFSYFKPHKWLFFADLFCAVFVAAVDVIFPVISRFTLNKVLPQYLNSADNSVQRTVIFTFFSIIALCFLMCVLRTVAQWFITFFGHVFGVAVEKDMRRDIFEHIEKQSFSFFDKNRTGQLMSRTTTDLFEISELAHHGPEDLLISLLTLFGAFFVMFSIRWQLAVIVFVTLPLLIFAVYSSRKSLMGSSSLVKGKTAEINSAVESSISGARTTKIFTNEDYEFSKFEKSNQNFFDAKRLYYKAMAGMHSKMEFVTHILSVIILAVGGFYIMKGKMTLGDLVAANMFVAAFLQPIRRLANFVEQFSTGMAGFMRFSEMMQIHEEMPEKTDAVELSEKIESVDFENVSFDYSENFPVLKNISLEVKKGQTVAFVGPSGGGKTTLCNLLARFYEVKDGSIKINGIDIRDYKLKSLRSQIGFVQQDVFMFAGTIRENIAYGRPDATEAEIIEAAKEAEIYDDIMNMQNGFDSVIGERGIKLSGGQKQRISIARVFLKNPPVLVLDEATSALDSITEQKIQSAFDRLCSGRTAFVIAHRLSTIKNADKIAVLENHKIVESGTHEQLLSKKGEYFNLYTAQVRI
ncbi:ATP-binding cassette, subfamily B [Treponema berlinense]|uniref:ATP-binding cassette, subfamily B n=1 Tax=Treponema berlinense TaxID=225004 RepID=A0A1T4NLH0_9SPIR|nr:MULTISPECIES: ABC transporter ATP-binding protein [Treponema]MBQ9101866.1 ABC transporter ATP-binding protein [Treponema sp.]MDD5834677.1 ABC transporter ATP-binding protein [Treponema berlinense]SJZ80032.1 ATP-binding cassette, subfamily B [Treponema berlinense]